MRKTLFAGLTALDPGDTLATDGFSFQSRNPEITDHLLELGAVTHRHDARLALANPAVAPSAAASAGVGSFPADTSVFVGYTLLDEHGGETTMAPAVTLSTRESLAAPDDVPSAVADYTAGVLRADTYYYALTFSDGAGGETTVGPSIAVEREPGFASGRVLLSGMATLAAAAGAPAWRLYRATGGGRLAFLAQGATDAFTDDGTVPCDCNVSPPPRNITNGANRIGVVVPSAAGASGFALYLSETGDFTSPSFAGAHPIADAGDTIVFDGFDVDDGAPPDVSSSVPGASKINPDTDLLDWNWKRSVDTTAELPAGDQGDVRLVRGTATLYAVLGSAAAAPGDWTALVGAESSASGTVRTVIVGADSEVAVEALEVVASGATIERIGNTARVTIPVPSGGTGEPGGGSGTLQLVSASGGGAVEGASAITFVSGDGAGVTVAPSGASAIVTVSAVAGPEGPAGSGNVRAYDDAGGEYAAGSGMRFIAGAGTSIIVDQSPGQPQIADITISASGGAGPGGDQGTWAGIPGDLTEWQPLELAAGWTNLNVGASGAAAIAKDLTTGLVFVRAPLARATGAGDLIAAIASGSDVTGTYWPEVSHAFVNEQEVGVEISPAGEIRAVNIDDEINQVVLSMLVYRGSPVEGAGTRGGTLKADVVDGVASYDPYEMVDAGTGAVVVREGGRYHVVANGRAAPATGTVRITAGASTLDGGVFSNGTFSLAGDFQLAAGTGISLQAIDTSFDTGARLSVTKVEGNQGQAGEGGSPGDIGAEGATGPAGADGADGAPGPVLVTVSDEAGNFDELIASAGGLSIVASGAIRTNGYIAGGSAVVEMYAPSGAGGGGTDGNYTLGGGPSWLDGDDNQRVTLDTSAGNGYHYRQSDPTAVTWQEDPFATDDYTADAGAITIASATAAGRRLIHPHRLIREGSAVAHFEWRSDDADPQVSEVLFNWSTGYGLGFLAAYDPAAGTLSVRGVNGGGAGTELGGASGIAVPTVDDDWWLRLHRAGDRLTAGLYMGTYPYDYETPTAEVTYDLTLTDKQTYTEFGNVNFSGRPGFGLHGTGIACVWYEHYDAFLGSPPEITLDVEDNTGDTQSVVLLDGNGRSDFWPPRGETSFFTDGPVASGAMASGFVDLGKTFELLSIETSQPMRVRLYTRTAKLAADAARALATPPVGNHGVIVDLVTDDSDPTWDMTPNIHGSRLDDDSPLIPMQLTNLGTEEYLNVVFTSRRLER